MRAGTLCQISAFLVVCSAAANSGVVQLGLSKEYSKKMVGVSGKSLHKRDTSDTANVSLIDDRSMYYANITLGTPGQQVKVQIDTGSSDLWVPGAENAQCETNEDIAEDDPNGNYCSGVSSFDADESETWKVNNTVSNFSISYLDKSFAEGVWGTDTIKWGDLEVENFFFGYADDYNSTSSVFGIAMPAVEASTNEDTDGEPFEYPNFPIKLKDDGLINKIVYSLYSTSKPPPDGSFDGSVQLLFGGVNHAKYEGTLTTLPLTSNESLSIALNGVGISEGSNITTISTNSYSAVLDSGSTDILFTESLLAKVLETFTGDLQKDEDTGYYQVPCPSESDPEKTILFDFGGSLVSVDFSDLIQLIGESTCVLRIQEAEELLLGDLFLRNAYVVYDLEDKEISIAPVKFNDEDNIEAVMNTIPSATRGSEYSSTSADTVFSASVTATDNVISSLYESQSSLLTAATAAVTNSGSSAISVPNASSATASETVTSVFSSMSESKSSSGGAIIQPPFLIRWIVDFLA